MSSLQSLPTELVELIVLNLEHDDLFDLLCTSRRLYHAILPSLYRSIVISPTPEVLNSLLQTIFKKKWLAEVTRELKILDHWLIGSITGDGLSKADTRILASEAEPLYQNRRVNKRLVEEFEGGNEDTLVALLVMSLPFLEKLDFVLPERYQEDDAPKGCFMDIIVRCANREPPFDVSPRLTRLSSVTTRSWGHGPNEGYGADQINHFLKFPSMRHICAHQMVHFPPIRHEWNYPRQSPTTHIELYNSCSGISTLVDSCKTLTSFVYQQNNYDADETIPSEVRKALLPFQDTLETLSLDFTPDCNDFGSFGSVADFTALRQLHIDMPQLIPEDTPSSSISDKKPHFSELLPRTLETLHICSVDVFSEDDFLDNLKALTRAAPERLPSLREILIVPDRFWAVSTEQIAKHICAERGIKCTLELRCGCFRERPIGSSASSLDDDIDFGGGSMLYTDEAGFFSDVDFWGGFSSDDFGYGDDDFLGGWAD